MAWQHSTRDLLKVQHHCSSYNRLFKEREISMGQGQQTNFEILKDKRTTTPVLALPNFDKLFEVDIDASQLGIRAVLMQEGKPLEYFSEKLSDARQK